MNTILIRIQIYLKNIEKRGKDMNTEVLEPLVTLGTTLTELAVKTTATSIATKVKSIKDEKNIEKIRNTYDELLNNLLEERQEAIRIAMAYKSELEKVEISDEDIKHLHTTIESILCILAKFSPQLNTQDLNTIVSLISIDTLRTMQLLGFNYKAAIGEPLTKLCSDKILSFSKGNKNNIRK